MEYKLPPGQQLVGSDKWPLVGEREPLPAPDCWTLTVTEPAGYRVVWTLDELKQLPTIEMKIDIHCVTRWSKLGSTFVGVTLETLLQQFQATKPVSNDLGTAPAFVSFVAHSQRDHSTSLRLSDAIDLNTLVAWEVDGRALSVEHGGPLRNIVPQRYFYKSVKWLKQIDLLLEDRLGYWEADAGYHNHADPFKEQRYLAPNIDKRTAKKLIAQKIFDQLDLRGLHAENLDLHHLSAVKSLLRDAHFESADLTQSNFSGANLSNSHFAKANLSGANFEDADLEGADFSGANLIGVNWKNASLFGASFVSEISIDTRMDPQPLSDLQLAALTEQQSQWVRQNGAH